MRTASPSLLIQHGLSFNFYLSDQKEPPYVQAHGSFGLAKVWLQPVKLEYAKGRTQADRRRGGRNGDRGEPSGGRTWFPGHCGTRYGGV